MLFRVIIGVLVLASFGVWFYAYSGRADRPPPDELDSTTLYIEAFDEDLQFSEINGLPAYGKRAEVVCEAATDSIPNARFADDQTERAAQIRGSNLTFEEMIADLRSLPVATARDDELRNLWLDDWQILLSDRERYAANVEEDPGAIFTLTVVEGERLERRITRFARTNLMLPCAAPTDIG